MPAYIVKTNVFVEEYRVITADSLEDAEAASALDIEDSGQLFGQRREHGDTTVFTEAQFADLEPRMNDAYNLQSGIIYEE